MAPILAYYKTRTLAQHIRLVLVYTGTKFEDYHYIVGDPPTYDKSQWYSVKYKLGLDFPNLPYYIDDDVRISQSNAILRYLGRKHNLGGRSEEERIRLDMLLEEAMDFAKRIWDVAYYNMAGKDEYLKNLPIKLQQFSDFLGDKPWFVSTEEDGITIAEFAMYEFLHQHIVLEPSCLDKFENMKGFMKRFCGLPRVQEYMASPEWLEGPSFNIYSQFEVEKRKKQKEEK